MQLKQIGLTLVSLNFKNLRYKCIYGYCGNFGSPILYVMCYQRNWGPVLEFFISLRKEFKSSQFRRRLENTFTNVRERRTKDGAGVLQCWQLPKRRQRECSNENKA